MDTAQNDKGIDTISNQSRAKKVNQTHSTIHRDHLVLMRKGNYRHPKTREGISIIIIRP
jgi:hypothetical protein